MNHNFQILSAIDPASKIATIIIALFVAYVGFQQWSVNRLAVQEKLFDRRIEIYDNTIRFLYDAQQLEPSYEVQKNFVTAKNRSRFLFGSEVFEYLQNIHRREIQHRVDQSPRLSSEDYENSHRYWLDQQIDESAEIFAPYLNLSKL